MATETRDYILTVDVEDWFHILDNADGPPRSAWEALPSRVEANTLAMLDLFDTHDARATFFVLGWVAERFPGLVREIARRGHEVGCHGHEHVLVHELDPAAFAADLARSTAAITQATGTAPQAYRAAGFSITPECGWAFDALARAGYTIDASLFPGRHGHGGFPMAERRPFALRTLEGAQLYEFPIAAVDLFGRALAFGGGGYFRLLPGPAFNGALRHLGRRGPGATVYLHPREIDAGQPRVDGLGAFRRFKCYVGLKGARAKLETLLRRFRFTSMRDYLRSDDRRRDAESRVRALRARRDGRVGLA